MNLLKKIIACIIFLTTSFNFAQLGFCLGSKGEPIFSENFGNGTNYGPALPAGITNYPFIVGNPNDGFYTLYYRTNLYSTWHYSLDHTPDATNGLNGKALIVNASANTTGDFYKRTVTGLCANTTFEFSAWVMNVYNPGSGFCGVNQIPINVRFEIWNDTETILLGSGNTGNIMGTTSPLWQQFALVFTTSNETSVVLKMKNNGLGGCGNDLAIDDIEFRSCGDLTTISSPSVVGSNFSTCDSPVSIQLEATTSGVSTYFYQWQTSSDGINWTDISGANNSTYTTPNLSTLTYFRTKVAQDVANLNNPYCSTLSNQFTISFLTPPTNNVSDGDKIICINQTIPALTVTAASGTGINWYDSPSGGNLLLSNSSSFTPSSAGTYYAESYSLSSNCVNSSRTPVSLTIINLPTATISGTASICTGNTAQINFSGTPNAIITYTINGGSNQTIPLNSSGSANLTTTVLTANTTYNLVSVSSNDLNTCIANLNIPFLITVNNSPTATITGSSSICYNTNTILTFTGTANSIVTYTINNGANQTINLNSSGLATLTTSNLTTTTVYSLVSIISSGANSCTQTLSQNFTLSIIPLPIATISASPNSVCYGDTSTINFNGTPNSIVNYTINGGTNQSISLNSSGTASITTTGLTNTTTFQLKDISLSGTSNCVQLLSASTVININPTPTASYIGSTNYCSEETTNISLTSDIIGTTFNWTISQNGASGASSGTGDTITQTLSTNNLSGDSINYTVIPLFNGCSGLPLDINVMIHPLPNPILVDGTICLNSTSSSASYTLNTNLSSSNFSFQWFYEGNVISNAFNNTYEANQIGNYAVIATNTLTGCISDIATATVSEAITGESLIINQSDAFSDNPTIIVTVVGGNGPYYYQIDESNFQTSNTFYNVSSGNHTITVTDDSSCTNLSTVVTIINYPHYFTPNNDGYNDTWNIKGVDENSKIFIFDRYGKLLKQISPLGFGWDGTYNGQLMFSGDYWFTIEFIEIGIKKSFRSHFTLKR